MIHENGVQTTTGKTLWNVEVMLQDIRSLAERNTPEHGVASTLLDLLTQVEKSHLIFTTDEVMLMLASRAMQGYDIFSDADTYLDDQDGKARYEAAYEHFMLQCFGIVPRVALQLTFDNLHFLTVANGQNEARKAYWHSMNKYLYLVAAPRKQRGGVIRLSLSLELRNTNSLRGMAISDLLSNMGVDESHQDVEAAFDALRAALGNIRLTGVRIDERHDIF